MTNLEHFYLTLGLTPQASPEEIKQAYRKLAKIWHPDRFHNNPDQLREAEAKFKEIVTAYTMLKNIDSQEIFSAYTTGIYTQKSDPYLHYQKGVEYAELEDYQAAISEFTLAINLDDQLLKAYQYRGFIFSKLGYENRANADLRKAEELKLSQGAKNENSTVNSHDFIKVEYSNSDQSSTANSCQVWKLIKTLSQPKNTDAIKGMVICPDQQLFITNHFPSMMRQWSFGFDNNCFLNTLRGHSQEITCMKFSPDGQFLASGSDDKTIILWDFNHQNSRILGDGKHRHIHSVLALAFTPSQKILISGSADKTVKIWDLNSNYEPYTIQGYKGAILALCVHPSGEIFASGGVENILRIRQIETGKLIRSIQHPSEILSLCFSQKGNLLATGGSDSNIRLFETQTGELVRTLTGHLNKISSLCFSHDYQYLISGSWDQTVRVWYLNQDQEIQTIKDHSSQILTTVLNRDENILITGSLDGTIKVWEYNF